MCEKMRNPEETGENSRNFVCVILTAFSRALRNFGKSGMITSSGGERRPQGTGSPAGLGYCLTAKLTPSPTACSDSSVQTSRRDNRFRQHALTAMHRHPALTSYGHHELTAMERQHARTTCYGQHALTTGHRRLTSQYSQCTPADPYHCRERQHRISNMREHHRFSIMERQQRLNTVHRPHTPTAGIDTKY